MTNTPQDLETFIQKLSADAEMQKNFSNMLETADGSSIKQSIATFMQSAGFDVKEDIIDGLIQSMKQNLEGAELTDESLDAVSGGYKAVQGINLDALIGIGSPHPPIRISPDLIKAISKWN